MRGGMIYSDPSREMQNDQDDVLEAAVSMVADNETPSFPAVIPTRNRDHSNNDSSIGNETAMSFQEATLMPMRPNTAANAQLLRRIDDARAHSSRRGYNNNKSTSVFDRYRRRYNNTNKVVVEEKPEDQQTAPVPRHPVQPGVLSFRQYLQKYGYHIDEITQYVLDGLPIQAIGGGTITWNPETLRDAVARLCYETSWNKHRGFTLLS